MHLVLLHLNAQSSEQEYRQNHWNSTLAFLGAGSLVNIVTLPLAVLLGIGRIPALIILLLLDALVVWRVFDSPTPLEGLLPYGPPARYLRETWYPMVAAWCRENNLTVRDLHRQAEKKIDYYLVQKLLERHPDFVQDKEVSRP